MLIRISILSLQAVERNIEQMITTMRLPVSVNAVGVYNVMRKLAYALLGLNTWPNDGELETLEIVARGASVSQETRIRPGMKATTLHCAPSVGHFQCKRIL